MEKDPYSDHPVHEEYVKPGTKKQAFDELMQEREKQFERKEFQTYKCSCGFEFQKRVDKKVDRCPYCGRGADAFKKGASAQDILNEVSDE